MEVAKYQRMNYNKFQAAVVNILISNILADDLKNDKIFKSLIAEADKDGDGEIDYNEFIEMMDKMK